MRILYLSQYFHPEAGATQARAYEMAIKWIQMGHKVTMLTEFPNHPSGIIPPSYRGKLFERINLDGIDVIRVWVKASPVKNISNRLLFYLTYMINAIIAGLILVRGKYDFLYATSPPLFVGGAALVLSRLKCIPMFFEVRDLWPETAVEIGELSNPHVISIATKLEEMCYQRAIQVVVVTQGMYDRLIQRSVPPSKLIISPNGANIELFTFKLSERNRIRTELGLESKFIAIYAGIHGLAQGLETVVQTAHLLADKPNIHFILIGDGPKKAVILALAKSYNLPNLTMLPEKPRELIPYYLSAADVALVPLRKTEIFKSTLPSKLFDAWSCKRPVIVSIDGEARAIVETVKGGIFISPEDPVRMAEALIYLMNSPAERQSMGENGLAYTKQNHSRSALAEKLIILLEKYIQN
jgi:glycosyltransferase involved in cell wall biosynthesis